MPPPARSTKAFTMAYPGFQRGGCLSSGPIRKAGGGGAVGFWPGTKSGGGVGVLSVSGPVRKAGGGGGGGGGGGCCRFLARYEKQGGGGGGGGAVGFGPGTKSGGGGVWPNTSAYLECAGGGC